MISVIFARYHDLPKAECAGSLCTRHYQFHSSSSSSLGGSARENVAVSSGPLLSGTRTLPSADKSSSSSKSDAVLGAGEVLRVFDEGDVGESEGPKGLEVTDATEGVVASADGEVSAARSELAASEMRRDARFWLFVKLINDVWRQSPFIKQ